MNTEPIERYLQKRFSGMSDDQVVETLLFITTPGKAPLRKFKVGELKKFLIKNECTEEGLGLDLRVILSGKRAFYIRIKVDESEWL